MRLHKWCFGVWVMSSLWGWPVNQSVDEHLYQAFVLRSSLMEANDLLGLKQLARDKDEVYLQWHSRPGLTGMKCAFWYRMHHDVTGVEKSTWFHFCVHFLRCWFHVEFKHPQVILSPRFCTGLLGTVCSINPIHLLAVLCLAALAGGFAPLPVRSWCFNPGFNPRGYGRLQTSDSWSMTGPRFNPHQPWAAQNPSVARFSRHVELRDGPGPPCPISRRELWWIW